MNKRVLGGILLFVVSILAIVGAVLLFNSVPNVEVFTPKEAAVMAAGVMLGIIGVVGIALGIFMLISAED